MARNTPTDTPATDTVVDAAPEQTQDQAPEAQAAATEVATPTDQAPEPNLDVVLNIPVQLTVELGRTRMTIQNILQLGQGSVIELDRLAGEPLDIYANGYLFAQGEVVSMDDKYGIRITDIATAADRFARISAKSA